MDEHHDTMIDRPRAVPIPAPDHLLTPEHAVTFEFSVKAQQQKCIDGNVCITNGEVNSKFSIRRSRLWIEQLIYVIKPWVDWILAKFK